jgi:xanthine dehydrogenase YagS FAD-binding subunit
MSWHIGIDEPKAFELLQPKSVAEAAELSARYDGRSAFLAGGCDLLDQLKHQWSTYEYVINLKSIPQLKSVQRGGASVRLGALTTLGQIERHPELKAVAPGLVAAATRVATPQIRNAGTIGGNLLQDSRCPYYRGPWYCYRAGGIVCDAHHGVNAEHAIFGGDRCYTVTPSDTAPMLVALGATAHIFRNGADTEMAVADLFVPPAENIRVMHRLGAGEILTELEIPLRTGARSNFVKFAPRGSWDFAQASVAVALSQSGETIRDVRIVLGAVAPTPWRSQAAESQLEGKKLTDDVIEAAARAATEGATPLAYNEYKIPLVRKLVRQALRELVV